VRRPTPHRAGNRGSGSEPGSRRAPGELEAEVLAALWAAPGPLTPGEVQAELGSPLAYSTVVTILSRLHAKGALERHREGRAYAYTPVQDGAGLAARRMHRVLDERSDRGAVLTRFVSDLSSEDGELLRDLLRGIDAAGNTDPPREG
jgi:predicted transcriptional regulator